jgi:hypothetical protein
MVMMVVAPLMEFEELVAVGVPEMIDSSKMVD